MLVQKSQEKADKIYFKTGKDASGIREKLRFEIAGLEMRNIGYEIRADNRVLPTLDFDYNGFRMMGLDDTKKFVNHYLFNTHPVTKPTIFLCSDGGSGDLNKREIKTVGKMCSYYGDIFGHIAFRNSFKSTDLVSDYLKKEYGIGYSILDLNKKELAKAYRAEKKRHKGDVLPAMIYNGKEVNGLKDIASNMDAAIEEVRKIPAELKLSSLDKRRVKWWWELAFAHSTGINHGDDVHDEETYPE
ncbi:MAG: hypothetical protein HY833_02320 [Candidatus Aenigmarchaeota archaeon]|nr:hypothetical protein [Candidatus Aenigmarchaeota archaeon]